MNGEEKEAVLPSCSHMLRSMEIHLDSLSKACQSPHCQQYFQSFHMGGQPVVPGTWRNSDSSKGTGKGRKEEQSEMVILFILLCHQHILAVVQQGLFQ
jgi:hypothetical protein